MQWALQINVSSKQKCGFFYGDLSCSNRSSSKIQPLSLPVCRRNIQGRRVVAEKNKKRSRSYLHLSELSDILYEIRWNGSCCVREANGEPFVFQCDYSSSAPFTPFGVRRAFLISDVASTPAAATAAASPNSAMAGAMCLFLSWHGRWQSWVLPTVACSDCLLLINGKDHAFSQLLFLFIWLWRCSWATGIFLALAK